MTGIVDFFLLYWIKKSVFLSSTSFGCLVRKIVTHWAFLHTKGLKLVKSFSFECMTLYTHLKQELFISCLVNPFSLAFMHKIKETCVPFCKVMTKVPSQLVVGNLFVYLAIPRNFHQRRTWNSAFNENQKAMKMLVDVWKVHRTRVANVGTVQRYSAGRTIYVSNWLFRNRKVWIPLNHPKRRPPMWRLFGNITTIFSEVSWPCLLMTQPTNRL